MIRLTLSYKKLKKGGGDADLKRKKRKKKNETNIEELGVNG